MPRLTHLLLLPLTLGIHANFYKTPLTGQLISLDQLHHPSSQPPHPSITVESWTGAKIPRWCHSIASRKADSGRDHLCDADKIQVFNVIYDDCPEWPWMLCRCPDAETSMEAMVKDFGRMGAGLRSGISHIMAVSGRGVDGGVGTMAFNSGARVFAKGNHTAATWAHESFHSFDNNFHDSDTFKNAIESDSCVPNDYANVSPTEDFAELGTWVHYQLNAPQGPGKTLGVDASCMKNQLEVVRDYVTGNVSLATSRCFERSHNDELLDLDKPLRGPVKVTKFPESEGWETRPKGPGYGGSTWAEAFARCTQGSPRSKAAVVDRFG